MTLRTDELKNRVKAKRKRLEARVAELTADAQGKTADEIDTIKAKLEELEDTVRGGWDSLTDRATKRLSDWLDA